ASRRASDPARYHDVDPDAAQSAAHRSDPEADVRADALDDDVLLRAARGRVAALLRLQQPVHHRPAKLALQPASRDEDSPAGQDGLSGQDSGQDVSDHEQEDLDTLARKLFS